MDGPPPHSQSLPTITPFYYSLDCACRPNAPTWPAIKFSMITSNKKGNVCFTFMQRLAVASVSRWMPSSSDSRVTKAHCLFMSGSESFYCSFEVRGLIRNLCSDACKCTVSTAVNRLWILNRGIPLSLWSGIRASFPGLVCQGNMVISIHYGIMNIKQKCVSFIQSGWTRASFQPSLPVMLRHDYGIVNVEEKCYTSFRCAEWVWSLACL